MTEQTENDPQIQEETITSGTEDIEAKSLKGISTVRHHNLTLLLW